jgi:hypothetical protein
VNAVNIVDLVELDDFLAANPNLDVCAFQLVRVVGASSRVQALRSYVPGFEEIESGK